MIDIRLINLINSIRPFGRPLKHAVEHGIEVHGSV